jgi:aryl-alcohol dehydrogenase-like predicted oxidoreductase
LPQLGSRGYSGSQRGDGVSGIATVVQDFAGGIGATPAQVAIAWTKARSPATHLIIGARRLDRLLDNLGAADLELPAEALSRLDTATEPDLGFSATFIHA